MQKNQLINLQSRIMGNLEQICSEAGAMTDNDYKAILNKSWQLRRDKRYPEAELLLHEALAGFPAGNYVHNLLKANLADTLLRQGNFEAASRLAIEVLEKVPTQATALTVLGMAALEKGAIPEAVENLQKAYDQMPNAFRAGRLARALELAGQTEEALTVLQEALHDYPGDSYLLKQYSALEEKAAAGLQRGRGLQVLPDEIQEDDFLPYAEKIKDRLRSMEPAEAASQLQKVIRVGRRKENPHLHLLLGDLIRKAGDESAAAEAYRRARELDPDNMLALSQLLFTYRRLGRKEESWPLLKLLLYHRPGNKTAKASLLKDAVELGKEEETALFIEELVQKYPHHKELYGAIRKLKTAAEGKRGDR